MMWLNKAIMSSTRYYSSVSNSYEGKSIFITGATGFLGKVLVEKLLHDCSGIHKVYILTRAKKGLSLDQRVRQLIDSPVFQRLKSHKPEVLNKIIPVAGDLAASGLGLDANDEQTLLENVSVVFHSAATIDFNEPLRVALSINLEGTIKVLDLCKRMRHIHALVYVSTTYCNPNQEVVEERVYPPAANINDVYKFVELHGDDEAATNKLLNGWPNTYTFSKSLTEAYLAEHHGNIRTVILRPSIITAALNEPLKGWLDGWQGNTTILTTAARGFFRVIMCDAHCVVGLIPVDYVANMAIVAAVQPNKEVSVYNCCTSGVNPVTWETMAKLFIDASKADNFHTLPWPGLVMTRSRVVLAVLTLLMQTVPAYVLDAWSFVTRNRTKYVKLHGRMIKLRDLAEFFSTRGWSVRSDRASALAAALSSADARRFPCHPGHVHWLSYMPIYYRGVKTFLIGDK